MAATISMTPTVDADVSKVATAYTFRRAAEVEQFLREHPSLIDMLVEARAVIQRVFLEATTLTLEVVSDPEIAGERTLFAYISSGPDALESAHRLRAFDQEWFLRNVARAGRLLHFDVE